MKTANPRILTINGGSSSIKFAIFDAGDSLRRILEGGIERIGLPEATFRVKGSDQADNFSRLVTAPDHTVAVGALMDWIEERSGRDALTAVGHRVVHGGPKYYKPERITAEMVTELKRLSPFDPDHMPEEILLTEAFHRRFPDLPQVACFDTAFHHDLPRVAQLLPIPRRYEAQGVRRYGFHGLSYAFLMEELARLAGTEVAQRRVILAHLGNGASLAAVRDGKSVDTSMSFTPTAGVPMSTRSGDLDPGLVWYLARTEKMTDKQFNEMVNFQSGLLGISETSPDMRDLLEHETQDVRAAEAVALFCYQVKKWIGAFAAALGGLDTLVFAGGIGENAPPIRARICDGLGFLGIELEEKQNAANEGVISAAASRVAVRVIRTDEERMIAKTVCRVLGLGCKTENRTMKTDTLTPELLYKTPEAVNKKELTMKTKTLTPELLHKMDAYWRAANYLSVGQIYLYDNPLLKRPLTLADVKHMLLGHWGTTPGQNFIYVHLNRVIKKYNLDMIYVSGPGHGGPAVVGNTYLEGTYSEIYPNISQDEAGLRKLFVQFSFPGGIPSHASPECPGSIHEGGELGYSLSHSFGAVFDNPDLVVACVVGDGEAETGPLATAWHSNKFLDPATDGAVLPILHLNGYKISNPTILARITREELEQLLRGYGWTPYFVEGHEPGLMHEAMAATLDTAVEQIQKIQQDARVHGNFARPRWPMIVLNSPKGWTGPKIVDGLQVEGTFRSHQVPLSDPATHPEHLKLLEDWLRSYRPEELFDEQGRLKPELAELAPKGERRMGANPHANGGMLLRDLRMPDFRDYAVDVPSPGVGGIGDTHVLGRFLRDVEKLNSEQRNFRVFGPDETLSNGLEALFEVTKRQWDAATVPNDEFLAPTGQVMEMLSEHQCEGWLEGYLLTGRHGLFNCYEAFIHIVDSMFNQHAKWLKVTSHLPWRRKIASLNYLLASHVWRQDHNGFTHQDPGFIDHVVNKKAEVVRVYLPPDANCLLSVMDHCLRSRHYVNLVIAGKHPAPQWLTMDAAVKHCTEGIGIWQWASNDQGVAPDVVMACCGDVPTLETLAAVSIMREHLPDLKIRVVNVVDLMKMQPQTEHPHGLSDMDFDEILTKDKPVIFAFHAYPWLIHRLTYRRTNHDNIHVRGYKEEGTITTPFDMTVLNDLDRFHLVMDAIDRVPQTGEKGIYLKQQLKDKLVEHKQYIDKYGEDMPEIRNWKWSNPK
jgi:xylulose-5-phosphate/fructose-6-phosphate phosphoketolase